MNSQANLHTITALDLDSIKQKVMQGESGEGWTLERATAVELEYRRFLYLTKMFPHEHTAPLPEVDIFWHHHILDTVKYAADCEQVFGYFLHHVPDSGARGPQDQALHERNGDRARELYEATFGESYYRAAQHQAIAKRAQPMTAWCVPTQESPTSATAAWCVPTQRSSASAQAAWCVPTQANPASPTPMSKVTAWCVPTEGNPAAARQRTASTAWCVPTKPSGAAWCVPTTVAAASSQPTAADTAWCVPTQRSPALLQGATLVVAQSQAAQNNSRFAPAVMAEAA